MCMREGEKDRGREDEGKFSAVNPVLREGNSFIFVAFNFFSFIFFQGPGKRGEPRAARGQLGPTRRGACKGLYSVSSKVLVCC